MTIRPRVDATFSRFHTMLAGWGCGILAARRRKELREFGSWLSDHPELKGCGRTVRKGRVGSATEILELTTTCRNKWLCPTCGYTASRKEAAKLKHRLRGWTGQGGAVALLTLTQSHCRDDGLAELWSRLEAGWAALVRGSGWAADKRAYGMRGYVRITEVVHNPVTGWNVHYHVVLLLDRALDQPHLEGLRASLSARFARGVACEGGHAEVSGQDLRPMTPGTEAAVANYYCKGITTRWFADGSRTPMAVLDDLQSSGEGLGLWDEFTNAVTVTKRMQVVTSRSIDSLCTGPPLS